MEALTHTRRHRRDWLIAAAVLLLLVVALRLWLDWVGPLPGDRYAIAHWFDYRNQSSLTRQIAMLYATVGEAVVAVLTIVFGVVVLYRRDGTRTAVGLLLASGVVVVNAALRGIWGPTPLWHDVVTRAGSNFPSGHVAYATAVLGYLALAGRRHRQPELVAIFLLLVIGMGPARVRDGSHLVSDAIAGYLLGAGWLILVCLWAGPAISIKQRPGTGTGIDTGVREDQSGSVRSASPSPPIAARSSSE